MSAMANLCPTDNSLPTTRLGVYSRRWAKRRAVRKLRRFGAQPLTRQRSNSVSEFTHDSLYALPAISTKPVWQWLSKLLK